MGKKRWMILIAVAAVLTAALAAPLLSINAAPADAGDIAAQMTIDMDVQPHKVQPGGAQVQYTIDLHNLGAPTASSNLAVRRYRIDAATNVEIWAILPAGFTYASTDAITEVGATRGSTDPSPGDTTPAWGYWTIQPGGHVTIVFTANVPPGIPPGTYDANAYASGDIGEESFEIDDEGPTGEDSNTPSGEDPELDEDVTVGCTVGGIVEQVDTLELAAASTGTSDGGYMAIAIALGTGMAVLFSGFLVWSLRRRRVISAGESQ